nr:hypothetical protein [Tanacetum cinerariifolium]
MMNEEDMFGVNDLDGDEVVVDILANEKVEQSVKAVEKEVSTADTVTTVGEVVTTVGIEVTIAATTLQISKDELTLAQTLIEIKALNARLLQLLLQQLSLLAQGLRKKGLLYVDCELAARLPEEERGKLSIEEKSRMFVELMDKRKRHFARLRAKKIRSKPPTKDQKRNQMCIYLKNMANYKHNQLKNKSFEEIQMLFNNTMKWIGAFVPMDTELVKGIDKAIEGNEKAEEGSSKRATCNLEQRDAKSQRLEEENESAELKRCLKIIPKDDDDVTIEATPLSFKSPTIVDYKI